jgi:PAS domain S-box-containing protein
VVKRITSIQTHVKAVKQHVKAVKHLQESQNLLRTARKRLHSAQEWISKRLSPKEYVEMLEELPLPAYLLDREQPCFIAANSKFCKLIGYSQKELMGLPFMKAIPDDVVPIAEKAFRKNPPENSVHWRFRRSDGEQITLLLKYRRTSLFCDGRKLTNVSFTTVLKSQDDVEVEAVKYFS